MATRVLSLTHRRRNSWSVVEFCAGVVGEGWDCACSSKVGSSVFLERDFAYENPKRTTNDGPRDLMPRKMLLAL